MLSLDDLLVKAVVAKSKCVRVTHNTFASFRFPLQNSDSGTDFATFVSDGLVPTVAVHPGPAFSPAAFRSSASPLSPVDDLPDALSLSSRTTPTKELMRTSQSKPGGGTGDADGDGPDGADRPRGSGSLRPRLPRAAPCWPRRCRPRQICPGRAQLRRLRFQSPPPRTLQLWPRHRPPQRARSR